MHIGVYRHGCDRDSLIVDRRFYRGADLYPAYDTRQVILSREHPACVGLHTVLSPYHTKGRYLGPAPSFLARFFFAVIGYDWTKQEKRLPRKEKKPIVKNLMRFEPDARVYVWNQLKVQGDI